MPLGVEFQLIFIGPEGGGFELFFCLGGWGIRPSKKLPGGGGMVRLGID